jgi:hypothetical protein
MRYLLGALFLASCTMFTPIATDERPLDPSVPVTHGQISEKSPEARKPKSGPIFPISPVPEISSCAALDAGDLKETIKAKLDCITENTP